VRADPGQAAAPRAGDGHVEAAAVVLEDAPQLRGGAMGECGAVPARQHGRQPPRVGRQRGVRDGVDASMQADQPAVSGAPADRRVGQPGRPHLRSADDAVLRRRQAGDHRVRRARGDFFRLGRSYSPFVCHAWSVADEM